MKIERQRAGLSSLDLSSDSRDDESQASIDTALGSAREVLLGCWINGGRFWEIEVYLKDYVTYLSNTNKSSPLGWVKTS